jgi:hypothetical protein
LHFSLIVHIHPYRLNFNDLTILIPHPDWYHFFLTRTYNFYERSVRLSLIIRIIVCVCVRVRISVIKNGPLFCITLLFSDLLRTYFRFLYWSKWRRIVGRSREDRIVMSGGRRKI